MPTFDDLRKFARTIPEVEESTSYGTPALKYRMKLVARLREDGQTLAMVAGVANVEALPQVDSSVFSVPEHYAGYGMIVVDLAEVRQAELEGLFQDAIQILRSKGTRSKAAAPKRNAPAKIAGQ